MKKKGLFTEALLSTQRRKGAEKINLKISFAPLRLCVESKLSEGKR
jgi:hypothetical protein